MAEAKSNEIQLKNPSVSIHLDVLHKPGAVRLDEYPLLTYAPMEHGPGIRTEDNGTLVSDIVVEYEKIGDNEKVAQKFMTTKEHVQQAIQFAASASRPVEEKPAENKS